MSEIGGDRPSVDAIIDELISASVPQDMRMDARRPIPSAVRRSILKKPLGLIGALRSVMKTNDPGASLRTRRSALISTPESGCGPLSLPFRRWMWIRPIFKSI